MKSDSCARQVKIGEIEVGQGCYEVAAISAMIHFNRLSIVEGDHRLSWFMIGLLHIYSRFETHFYSLCRYQRIRYKNITGRCPKRDGKVYLGNCKYL